MTVSDNSADELAAQLVISPHAIQEAIRRGLLSLNHRGADVWPFGDKCNGCRRRQRPKRNLRRLLASTYWSTDIVANALIPIPNVIQTRQT
jgi:hypothetical protein